VAGIAPPLNNDNVQRLTAIAAATMWLSLLIMHFAGQDRRDNRELRLEIDTVREYALANMLGSAGDDRRPRQLPKPRGQVRPMPFQIGGADHLAGVDEDAVLAPVVAIDAALRRSRNGEAAS
jgi:hypothetical protein